MSAFKCAAIAFILAVLGVLSSALWGKPLEGMVLIALGTLLLGISFICEAIERSGDER